MKNIPEKVFTIVPLTREGPEGPKIYKKSIQNSNIVICTTIVSTVFLECISSNIPTFIFLDFDKNCISKECLDDVENLKRIGILQNDPYEFSRFINKHSKNINSWWNSQDVQSQIGNFRDNACSSLMPIW